jgi:hypothetical protein
VASPREYIQEEGTRNMPKLLHLVNLVVAQGALWMRTGPPCGTFGIPIMLFRLVNGVLERVAKSNHCDQRQFEQALSGRICASSSTCSGKKIPGPLSTPPCAWDLQE